MTTPLDGLSPIGFSKKKGAGAPFQAKNPATGAALEPNFYPADEKDAAQAAALAEQAFEIYGETDGKTRGRFLRAIAEEIEAVAEAIKIRAVQETGLPEGRIAGETGRTTGQLRMFAALVEEGSWVDARIDPADPARKPMPKADLRYMLKPLGPVVVFCASNFPLAFSVAGGDTASALAAGNPVIVKAHHGHPGTAEIVGQAVLRAAKKCDLPEGIFSLLHGSGRVVGQALVRHPAVRAVGFTGSREGGRELFNIAAARPEPIPVYAEMSSINPIFLLPGALAENRREEVAAGLQTSVTMGVGQFCTNPGLVMMPQGEAAQAFQGVFAQKIAATAPGTMLHEGIQKAYAAGVAKKAANPRVKKLAVVEAGTQAQGCLGAAAVFVADAAVFLADPSLNEEVFGPSTLLIEISSPEEQLKIARNLEGHLTASIFGTEEELLKHGQLVSILRRKVGRLLFNQFPTGVEVCPSMVHGGPYPATTDGRSTSVGTAAIYRFSRPVCYQNFPEKALPVELRNENALGLPRQINGKWTP